ncbi:NAD-dependent epimerase/dehydratase family protein [Ectopseudomonas oleovorans]|uniref:NAD-dependent epimerase/dehydratase family protein n=1 Tax=Ectopseudomonas oleovorans TaxID=301 RepID=UPI00244856E0|nr:NAD-dependent epimerase/dehydratase family protein [Pseudomonas oleovorans]MDG9980471.1 GDP-mannose 4,6-dehydratase [Pseudomonas oleovorans]
MYGDPAEMPISEQCSVGRPTNPYGRSKLMVEDILRDLALSDPRWRVAILRYFNPVGAHESGTIGEDPPRITCCLLLPKWRLVSFRNCRCLVAITQPTMARGRDYIHVVDLAQGHVAALRYLQQNIGVHTWNLGTGQGYSVLDMVRAFEAASGVTVPYKVVDRRAGDIAVCYSNPSKALAELGWKAQLGLERIMTDAWRWQKNSPNGYGS